VAGKRKIRINSCFGKVRHKDFNTARKVLKIFRKKHGHRVDIYKCTNCDAYHLGRKKKRKRNAFKL
jgi:hypothetical protein